MAQYWVTDSGNDTTGDGLSEGTAWLTIQKALDTITKDATTKHDVINLLGTFSISTGLDFSTLAPSVFANGFTLVGRGLSTLDDGSRAKINADTQVVNANTIDNVHFIGIEFEHAITTAGSVGFDMDNECSWIDCKFNGVNSTATTIQCDNDCRVINCAFVDTGSYCVVGLVGVVVANCELDSDVWIGRCGLNIGNTTKNTTTYGLITTQAGTPVQCHNSTFVKTAGTGTEGHRVNTAGGVVISAGNYFENLTAGINSTGNNDQIISINNHFRSCTDNIPAAETASLEIDSTTMAADLYTDAANSDWSIANTGAEAKLTKAYGGSEWVGGIQQINLGGAARTKRMVIQ